ncbi:MAG: ABC transporter permease [Candidatus Aminicenantales bacterium]
MYRLRGDDSIFIFIVLISVTFLGLGLIFASRMRDIEGFSIVMNFVILSLFFLSGALYLLDNFPCWLRAISYLDPLTYGVDGLRGILLDFSSLSVSLNLGLMLLFSVPMIGPGGLFF